MTALADAPGFAAVPAGYPKLGLAASSIPLRYRPDADLVELRARLERWEAARGRAAFGAYNLQELPVELAFEWVNVYVGLREKFPAVQVDGVDFRCGRDVMGSAYAMAWGYQEAAPKLRELAFETGVVDAGSLVEVAAELGVTRVDVEVQQVPWAQDLTCAGHLALSERLGRPRLWADAYRAERRHVAAELRAGRPDAWAKVAVSWRAAFLVHEFGHLVEVTITDRGGLERLTPVFAALSKVVLDVDDPTPEQWRYHLVNYPTRYALPGPHQGGVARQRATRAALRPAIMSCIGRYASSDRTELFAEAFVLAYAGTPAVRRRFGPFRVALRTALAAG